MNRLPALFAVFVVYFLCPSAVPTQELQTSVTISPLHLILPVAEINGEFLVDKDISLAGIVGIGTYGGMHVFELGSQFNYYLLGDFRHGMQTGVEALFVSGGGSSGPPIPNRIIIGPYLGHKVVIGTGFTINTQAGMALILSGKKSMYSGILAPTERGLFLNLNVGWSY